MARSRILLAVTRDAEDAAAIDGRCLPWVRSALAKADASRRDALRDLCNLRNTNAMREKAIALDAAGRDYRAVRAAAGRWLRRFVSMRKPVPFLSIWPSRSPSRRYRYLKSSAGDGAGWPMTSVSSSGCFAPPAAPALPNGAELERAAQSALAGRQFLKRSLAMPDSGTVPQWEMLLRWPHWSQTERAQLLNRLAEAERAAARNVLDTWPKEPPNRDTPVPPADARRVERVVAELRRAVTLLVLVDGSDAAEEGGT